MNYSVIGLLLKIGLVLKYYGVLLDNGAMHADANSWLYKMVKARTAKWRHNHIVNALQVQKIRAELARVAMVWTYYSHRATLCHGVREVPEGRVEVSRDGIVGRVRRGAVRGGRRI